MRKLQSSWRTCVWLVWHRQRNNRCQWSTQSSGVFVRETNRERERERERESERERGRERERESEGERERERKRKRERERETEREKRKRKWREGQRERERENESEQEIYIYRERERKIERPRERERETKGCSGLTFQGTNSNTHASCGLSSHCVIRLRCMSGAVALCCTMFGLSDLCTPRS